MKKVFFSLSALLALSLAGCSGTPDANDENVLVNNNFDTLAGWLPEPQNTTLSREQAHSGHYSIKVDGGHEYSVSYHEPLGQLHSTRIKKINVSAWAFVPTADAAATLVVAVNNPTAPSEKPLLWEGIILGQDKVFGKWTEIKKVITLPDNVLPSSTLVVYLWRTSGIAPVYLDDLRVTIEP